MNFANIVDQSTLPKPRLDPQRLQELGNSSATGQTPEARKAVLKKASKEFEAIFVYQMISAMRKTIGHGGLLEKSNGEKIFESMLDEEWGKKLTGRSGQNSLGELIYRQMSRHLGLEEETAPAVDAKGFMEMTRTTPSSMELLKSRPAFTELNQKVSRLMQLQPKNALEEDHHE